ncbi:MAG: hypothetical protein K2K38_04430 [Clostridia bacterium]|nr:hypothetical protein [Clostridia bacterium]
MKISAIDIGSNSVRLATFAGGKTLYKTLKTTRLGEGLSLTGRLKEEAIERSAQAVAGFYAKAIDEGADKVYAFATAAVRSSENGQVFIGRVKELCGLTVQVLSGEEEAKCGILGALGFGDGGIIDVGGASAEVTVQAGGKVAYAKSVNIGTVRLYDLAGRDKEKLLKVIKEKVKDYGDYTVDNTKMYAIGGTASRLGSIKHNLKEYHPEITDGTVLTLEEMYGLANKLLSMTVEEIRATTICGSSAEIVGGGCLLIAEIMSKFGIKEITVSEKDNLEGFVLLKEGRL